MEHSEFKINEMFWCGGRRWRCTDVGTRTIAAICLDVEDNIDIPVEHLDLPTLSDTLQIPRRRLGGPWNLFAGPPYKVVEEVFDEYDLPGCSLTREEAAEPFVDEESIASYLAEARATNDPQVIRKAMALAAVARAHGGPAS